MQRPFRLSLLVVVLCAALAGGAPGRPSPVTAERFAPPLPNDQYWDTQFMPPGVEGGVYAMAVNGNDVYVGGLFEAAGGIAAHNLARWDGSRWHALGQAQRQMGAVYDLLVISGTLHVATFWTSTTPGFETPTVLTWDGQRWDELESHHTYFQGGMISDLQLHEGQLYAGGSFSLGGSPRYDDVNIARWDGESWRPVGGGLKGGAGATYPGMGTVEAMTVYQGALIASGAFTTAAGAPADLIARWDGAAWSEVGNVSPGQFERIDALAASGGALYAGGRFASLGGAPASNVAAWDGTAWRGLGASDPAAPPSVRALALRGGLLYAGAIPSVETQFGLTVWNGTAWRQEPGFANRRIWAFGQNATALYLGGWFALSDRPTQSGSYEIGGVLRLAPGGWRGLGNGVPAPGFAAGPMAVDGASVYIEGRSSVLAWRGGEWSEIAPPGGISSCYCLAA
ncbi:MAG TPA: hypothetical protein VGE07_27110, partial [Herpetosiphonaceae bacterium]